MRLNDHYDWIVLGTHPAGLLSAALVARLGLSVLVVPMTEATHRFVSPQGNLLELESNYLIGLGQSSGANGLIRECLKNLEISPLEEELIHSERGLVQVLTQNIRFILKSNESLMFELQKEFGKSSVSSMGLVSALKYTESEYLTFWRNLPKRLTVSQTGKSKSSEPKTISELRRKLIKNLKNQEIVNTSWLSTRLSISEFAQKLGIADFGEICAGLWHAITLGININPALFDILHVFSLSRTGGSFKGGIRAYREFLLKLGKKFGVHVPPDIECRRIFIEKGRFAGVQITGRGTMISGRAAILGCSMERALEKAVYTGINWLHKCKKAPHPSGWKFTLAITVHKNSIPKEMMSRIVWQQKNAPPLEIEVIHPKDMGLQEDDSRFLYIRTIMPYTLESLKCDYQRLIAARMLRQVIEILPFIEAHIIEIYPNFNLEGTEMLKVYDFGSLAGIPDDLKVYTGNGLGNTSGIQGLSIASDESYPFLGNFGGTVAAIESVARVARQLGHAGPFV